MPAITSPHHTSGFAWTTSNTSRSIRRELLEPVKPRQAPLTHPVAFSHRCSLMRLAVSDHCSVYRQQQRLIVKILHQQQQQPLMNSGRDTYSVPRQSASDVTINRANPVTLPEWQLAALGYTTSTRDAVCMDTILLHQSKLREKVPNCKLKYQLS